MSEELKPCPFCKKKPLIRNAYGSVQPRLNHSCGFVDIHEGCPSDWNNAYCWQQLSRSEELNRELVKELEECLGSEEMANLNDSGALYPTQVERIKNLLDRVKEMGK